jgi:hypothetical protein
MNWLAATQRDVYNAVLAGSLIPTEQVPQLLARGIVVHYRDQEGRLHDPHEGVPAVQGLRMSSSWERGKPHGLTRLSGKRDKLFEFHEGTLVKSREIWSPAEGVELCRTWGTGSARPTVFINGRYLDQGDSACILGMSEVAQVLGRSLAGTIIVRHAGKTSKWTPEGLPAKSERDSDYANCRLIPALEYD